MNIIWIRWRQCWRCWRTISYSWRGGSNSSRIFTNYNSNHSKYSRIRVINNSIISWI